MVQPAYPLNSDALAHPQPQQVSIESILSSTNRPKPAQDEDIPAFLLKENRGR